MWVSTVLRWPGGPVISWLVWEVMWSAEVGRWSSPVLSSGEATPWVLCSALGFSLQEGHSVPGTCPKKGNENAKSLEHKFFITLMILWFYEQYIYFFCLQFHYSYHFDIIIYIYIWPTVNSWIIQEWISALYHIYKAWWISLMRAMAIQKKHS